MLMAALPAACLDTWVSNLGFHDLTTKGQLASADVNFVCGLGLKFIPTPFISPATMAREVKSSMDDLGRSIYLCDYFAKQAPELAWRLREEAAGRFAGLDEDVEGEIRFRVPNPDWFPDPSEYQPSGGVAETVDAMTAAAMDLAAKAVPPKLNMEKKHFELLARLKSTPGVVFSVADKNLGLVAMDVEDYRAACMGWLTTTHELDVRPAEEVLAHTLEAYGDVVEPFLEGYGIPKWAAKWLRVSTVRQPGSKTKAPYKIPAFRVLPKLPGFRPCTGNHCSVTQPAAKLVAYWLQPYVRGTASFCKDSDSVCRMLLELVIPRGALLFTCDVVKLYPRIRHGHFLEVLGALFAEMGFAYAELVLELLAFILAYNFCEFEGKVYRQTVGFATGVACGAEAANLYLWAMERHQLRRYSANLALFMRYIDDGCGVWYGERGALVVFLNELYAGSGLDITLAISATMVVFLDMVLFKDDDHADTGRLEVRVFQKVRNAYLYLPYRSGHAVKVAVSFIGGELARYVKRCSKKRHFVQVKMLFWARLLSRGYPASLLRKSFARVSFSRRQELLKEKRPDPDAPRIIPFCLPFSRQLFDTGVHTAVRAKFDDLLVHNHFRRTKFITAWRAAPRLAAKLVTFRMLEQAPPSSATPATPLEGAGAVGDMVGDAVGVAPADSPLSRSSQFSVAGINASSPGPIEAGGGLCDESRQPQYVNAHIVPDEGPMRAETGSTM